MPRIARLTNRSTATIYHLMSRTALDGYPLGDVEKEHLVQLIWQLSKLYFVDILGYCVMGNHFHLVARMHPSDTFSDAEVKDRYTKFYGEDRDLWNTELTMVREKLSDISVFMQEIKQRFTRFYNKCHHRRGFFWGGRFKSVIVEEGETLINLLAYVDLNPIRAGLVDKPEDYRWSSLGYHAQTENKDDRLSLMFNVPGWDTLSYSEIIRLYRTFVYEVGAIGDKGVVSESLVEKGRKQSYRYSTVDRFRMRTRWFTDSGVIGTKVFVAGYAERISDCFQSDHTRVPRHVSGIDGVYSLKQLSENI